MAIQKTISLQDISYQYQHHSVIENFSHTFHEGERISLLGPNGSGKTTLLHIIARLLEPKQGTITQSPNTIISYVFQDYRNALFPWMTVSENILYPLLLRGCSLTESKEKLSVLMHELNISLPGERYPYQLSGGQQQLANIVRSIIIEPDFLLLDEPFASLDSEHKESLYALLQQSFMKYNPGIIMISHDTNEAIRLSQKVHVLQKNPLVMHAAIAVPFDYPRDRTLEGDSRYNKIRQDLYNRSKPIST